MGSRAIAALALALLLAAAADAGRQAQPYSTALSWSNTPTIQERAWFTSPACTAWNNSSGSCDTWLNASRWTCGAPTYIYEPGNLAWLANSYGKNGELSNFTLTGEWTITAAGQKAANGVGAFNGNYCFNKGNATAQDVADLQAELLSVGLVNTTKGKVTKYLPVGTGQAFSATIETEQIPHFRNKSEWRAGSHSLQFTATTSAHFDAGTKWNTTTGVTANSITLNDTGGDANGDASTVTLFHMNEGAGGTTNDWSANSSGGSTDGTLVNAVWNTTGQQFGAAAITFDGTGDSVQTLDDADYDFPSSYTIEAWIYPFVVGGVNSKSIVTRDFVGERTFLFAASTGRLDFYTSHSGAMADHVQDAGANISAGAWYHVAAVYNDTENTIRLYQGQSGQGSVVATLTGVAAQIIASSKGVWVGDRDFAAAGFEGVIDEVRISNTTRYWGSTYTVPTAQFTAAPSYAFNGSWASQVFDLGVGAAPWYRWLNLTNDSNNIAAPPVNTGMSWEMRAGNSSWAQNDTTPAWTPLGNLTYGVNALQNHSRYAQFRASLWTNDNTVTPQLDAFLVNWTALPNNTANLTGNGTYAAPNQPVRLGVAYVDAESPNAGEARLSLNNSTSAGSANIFCENSTLATGNGTAYCSFAWNHTVDGVAPSFCGLLTDYDGAGNWTNCSGPVTTDSAAPLVNFPAIANVSSASFTLDLFSSDNASGVAATNYSLYNLSNDSTGTTAFVTNATFGGNGSVVICSTCHGNIRVAVMARDNIAAPYEHYTGWNNQSFWFSTPVLSNITVAAPSDYSLTTTVAVNVSALGGIGGVGITGVWVQITAPSGAKSINLSIPLERGTLSSGWWKGSTRLSDNFTESTGVYQFQAGASDDTTVDKAASGNATATFGSVGGGGSPGTSRGGGQSSSIAVYATPTPIPGAAAVTAPGTALACQPAISSYLWIQPWHRTTAEWSQTCRTATGVEATKCTAYGERENLTVTTAGLSAQLSGVQDSWWSCDLLGSDSIRFRYSVPISQIRDGYWGLTKEWSWGTFGRFTIESGANKTTVDARLGIKNLAAPLLLPLGPAQPVLDAVSPLSPASGFLAGLLFAGTFFLGATRTGRGIGFSAALLLGVAGLESPQGGILGLWVEFAVLAGLVWVGAKAETIRKLKKIQARHSP